MRSLAAHPPSPTRPSRSSRNQPQNSPSTIASDEDIQAQAATSLNDSPSAAIPIPNASDVDLEHGDLYDGTDEDDDENEGILGATLVDDGQGGGFGRRGQGSPPRRRGWRGIAELSLSAFSGEAGLRGNNGTDRNR